MVPRETYPSLGAPLVVYEGPLNATKVGFYVPIVSQNVGFGAGTDPPTVYGQSKATDKSPRMTMTHL